MRKCLIIVSLAIACGCETYRHQYVPKSDIAPQTQNRYSLKECHVYAYSNLVKEFNSRSLDAQALKDEDLREIEKLHPEVFSSDGIPVSIRVWHDMEKAEAGSAFLGIVDVFLFLGTVGVVPMVSASDRFVEVELEVGDSKSKSPRIGVEESSRCVIWTLGLNLLFPFDEPTDTRFSRSGRACVGMANENHSFSTGKRCRNAAYAYTIAAALTEYEKKTRSEAQQRDGVESSALAIEEMPL